MRPPPLNEEAKEEDDDDDDDRMVFWVSLYRSISVFSLKARLSATM